MGVYVWFALQFEVGFVAWGYLVGLSRRYGVCGRVLVVENNLNMLEFVLVLVGDAMKSLVVGSNLSMLGFVLVLVVAAMKSGVGCMVWGRLMKLSDGCGGWDRSMVV